MMKRIGDSIGASFHRCMSGLSARVVVHVQLTCRSGMTLTGLGGVTSSVPLSPFANTLASYRIGSNPVGLESAPSFVVANFPLSLSTKASTMRTR
jgi:hypothetical protein